MVKLVKMIIFFNQYLSFFVRIGLALGHYNPVYSVSSGIYKKREEFLWTLCIFAYAFNRFCAKLEGKCLFKL